MRKVTLIEAPIDFSAYGHKEGAGSGPQKIRELQIANILRKNNVDVSEVTNIKIPNTNNVTDITSKFEGETAEASINVKNVELRMSFSLFLQISHLVPGYFIHENAIHTHPRNVLPPPAAPP